MCGISPGFPKILSKFSDTFEQIFIFKVLPRTTYLSKQNNLFAFERALYGLSFDILDPYMQLIVRLGFSCGKLCKIMEKLLFFRGLRPDWGNTTRAAMAGLGSIGLIVLVIFH